MTASPLCILLNPAAGGGKAKARLLEILRFLRHSGCPFDVVYTQYPRHAIEQTEGFIRSGVTRIIAAGGDGTAFEVINGIIRSGCASAMQFGILPLGTGNSFLRDFGVDNPLEAAKRILKNQTQKVDIGKVTFQDEGKSKTYYFHNMMGFGFLAEACRKRDTQLRWFGKYGYHAAFFSLLPGLKSYSMTLRVDGAPEMTLQSPMLAVCNSQYTGRDMRISPKSSLSDGRLDVLLAEEMTAKELLNIFLSLPSGEHLQHPKIRRFPISRLEVNISEVPQALIDGELIQSPPYHIEALPAALEILV